MVRLLIVLGCGCQALGVGLVLRQITLAEDLFPGVGHWWAGVVRRALTPVRWLVRQLGQPRTHTVELSGQISIGSNVSAQGRVLRSRIGTSTQQLAALWKSVDDLYQELDARRQAASQERAELLQKLNSLKDEVTQELQKQAILMQRVSLGARGSQVLVAGLIILGIGLLGAAAWLS